jgi:hypothetical protein
MPGRVGLTRKIVKPYCRFAGVGQVMIDATLPAAGRSAAFAGSGGRRLVGDDQDRQFRILDQS